MITGQESMQDSRTDCGAGISRTAMETLTSTQRGSTRPHASDTKIDLRQKGPEKIITLQDKPMKLSPSWIIISSSEVSEKCLVYLYNQYI